MAQETLDALMETFEDLPAAEKREAAARILRRSIELDLVPLSDEELVESAESVFLELDRAEAEHG